LDSEVISASTSHSPNITANSLLKRYTQVCTTSFTHHRTSSQTCAWKSDLHMLD